MLARLRQSRVTTRWPRVCSNDMFAVLRYVTTLQWQNVLDGTLAFKEGKLLMMVQKDTLLFNDEQMKTKMVTDKNVYHRFVS